MEHSMKLNVEPFEAIRNHRKTVESRLNDEKRQKVKIGDTIVFTNIDDSEKKMRVKVTEKRVFDTFQKLFNYYDNAEIGYETDATLAQKVASIYSIYNQTDELNYGVVALKIELV